MIFYDFEVFKMDWLVVLVNPDAQTEDVIINDPTTLEKYYEAHKDDIWIGYNSTRYDQFILKGILCGFDPKKVNDWIIEKGQPGWKFSSVLNSISLLSYDVMLSTYSLKQLEGFMGNAIKGTDVSFNIDRKLTDAEIAETVKYCKSDVYNTIEVFMRTLNEFNAVLDLIKTFDLPMTYISKTKAQLSAIILGCERRKWDDEFDISIVDTLDIGKYKAVKEWFLNTENHDYKKSFDYEIAGVPHKFGWGGVHGAKEKYHGKGLIIHVDVTSYYPSLMIEYGLLTRNCARPEKYKEIYNTRVKLKKEGKKKKQAPYKIVLNGTYGICKDKLNLAYDPRQANNVCINGQLLLIDLIDKLESIQGFELIQSNTDGLIVKIPDTDEAFNQLDDVCYEWERRTRMGLGFDLIDEIWQGDVNNYIFRDADGKLERKGGYVKELSDLDNNLPIVNKAIVDFLTAGIPIETTINACSELKQFQMICKISSKYKCLIHGCKSKKELVDVNNFNFITKELRDTYYDGEILNERCVRVFASRDNSDGGLYKLHQNKTKPDKFPSTPLNCFIVNDDVNGMSVPDKLDREFYIKIAQERVKKFGK